MTIRTIVLASAILVTAPFSSNFVLAQNTIVTPDQGQATNEQSSREMKKKRQGQTSDEQSSRETEKQGAEGQRGDDRSVRDGKRERKEASRDRDRHGERSRSREGRFRYFHGGYYYATPWWTTGSHC